MKKIYTLIAAMLMLFTGNAEAQQGWEYNPEIVTEIIPGDENYYILQQGFGPANVHPEDLFLNSANSTMVQNVEHSCIYNFIEVGQKEAEGETFKIFILRNVANGQYITDNGNKYTPSPVEAFQFTARIAVAKTMTPELKENWYEYSNVTNGDKCAGAEGKHWIFCSPEAFKFMAFNGNPGFNSTYVVATNWRVYAAKAKELSAQEKFDATFNKYFGNKEISLDNYPVGNLPGCISQAMYDKLVSVYQEAYAATANPQTEEEYNRINKLIQDTFAEYETDRVKFGPGFYGLCNEFAGLLYDGTAYKCNSEMVELPAEWTIENAQYIWKVEEDPNNEGRYYIQNLSSERYIGDKSNQFAIVTNKKKPLFMNNFKGFWYNIKENNGYMHTKKDGTINAYGKDIDPNNHWKFFPIEESKIETLQNEIAQINLNKNLERRATVIENNLKALETKNGMTMDGIYANNAKGLVTEFEKTNADDIHTGSDVKNVFDGNIQTYYHTIWTNDAPANQHHWAQIDFGEIIQDVYIKMTKRVDNNGSNPTRIALYAAENDDLEAADWTEELFEDTVIYTISNIVADTIQDSTTYIQKVHFTRPVQHVRFTSTHTVNNKYWNDNTSGPTWCLAEMRFYKPEDCVHNPSYDLIPKDVINSLNEVIAKAKSEVAAGKGTQETLDALEEANEALWAAYPDPSKLNTMLESALYRYEVAVESAENADTDWGYYKKGAKEAYKKVVDEVAANIGTGDKVLTLEDITMMENKLSEAFLNFNNQLIVPANGIYHIVCAPGVNEETGENLPAEGGYVASVNSDDQTPAAWGYTVEDEIGSRWNTLWYIEKNAEGRFCFKNMATGLYLDNPYNGLTEEQQDSISTSTKITFSKTPKYFGLQAAPEAGKFVFNLKLHRYMNASSQKAIAPVGHPMAIWGNYKEENSRYKFEAATIDDLAESYKINCEKNAIQIVSVPLELKDAYTANGSAYKVLGVKNDLIQLQTYAKEEIIPAGTPMIIQTMEDEDFFEVMPTVSGLDGLMNATYNLSPVVQNGMVSAPKTFEIAEGFGMFFQGKVIATHGGEIINAGTGFFNKNIPATEEEGELAIPLKDVLTGEGTAVENVVIINNKATDVYTITGVKVRQDVKGSNATQGLPKGIYIVGGKKVLVK